MLAVHASLGGRSRSGFLDRHGVVLSHEDLNEIEAARVAAVRMRGNEQLECLLK